MKGSSLLAVGVALFLAPLSASAEKVAVDGSETQFESTITETIGGQQVTLDLTGTALREKAWVNVYAIASYVQQGSAPKSAEELAAADVPKKLHLVMERGVGGKKMADAFVEGIENNYKAEEFTAEIKALSDYFTANSVEEGDNIAFTHVPGVGVMIKVGEKEAIEIKNPKFAKAVWDIYFGQENIGDGVKKGLSSRLKAA